ncbi:MAG: EAL domain-containing protein [Spongiibacteraceae bacterium]
MPGSFNKIESNIDEIVGQSNAEINQAFNRFLRLKESDKKLLQSYHGALMQGSDDFALIFYDYLMSSPETAKVINKYQQKGGLIGDLVKQQLQHLFGFLSGVIDDESAEKMARIGAVHLQYGIEPVWIMGAYKLYLDHLQSIVRLNPAINDCDRSALENTLTKLLFRDMGLMLEGYWDSNLLMLSLEKERVVSLQHQITSLLSNIPQLLWSIDVVQNKPLYVSPSANEICDMDIDLPIPCLNWTVPDDRGTVELAWQSALQGRIVEVESRVKQPSGELRWFRRLFCPYKNDSGEVVRIDGLMEDTTELKVTLERLNTLATTDSLTGLVNRSLFYDRLTQAINTAERNSEFQVVVMIMDLNHFKEINDALGHPAGDEVLAAVGQRLQKLIRKTDSLARLGGDEFGILLSQTREGFKTAQQLAEKIQQAFVEPYFIDDNELFIGASIGITIYPLHGNDVATLMRRADVAMYSTKGTEERYRFYDAKLDPDAQKILQLSGDLRHAVSRGELLLEFQPKIDLNANAVMGVEALLRWQHPERGLITPDEFIPLSERNGVINSITDWVIETAIKQSKVWRDKGYEIKVAVNVSARCFHQSGDLLNKIEDCLEAHDMPSSCLEIEITENLLMSDIHNIFNILEQISCLGVTIAIDDFGTGYSSLAYLKKLPLQTLKIDKSFVLDMTTDENDAVIIRSTIDLAHNLGLSVVAEGVENTETLDLLTELGCDGAQGFKFSKPLRADVLLDWFKQGEYAMLGRQ